jgi:hypothetical protein
MAPGSADGVAPPPAELVAESVPERLHSLLARYDEHYLAVVEVAPDSARAQLTTVSDLLLISARMLRSGDVLGANIRHDDVVSRGN